MDGFEEHLKVLAELGLLLVVHFGSSFVVIIRVEAIGRGVGGGLSCRGQSLWLWCSERWLA